MCGVCVLGVGGGDGVGYLWLEGGEGLLVTEVSMTFLRLVECCFTSTETVGLLGTGSPGRPPRLSHSS